LSEAFDGFKEAADLTRWLDEHAVEDDTPPKPKRKKR
jgi:hypothetical protein